MDSLGSMEVRVSADLRRFVERSVRSGRYRSPSAAVAAGLRLLREEERWRRATREKIDQGLADIDAGRTLDARAALRKIRARSAGEPGTRSA